MIEPTLWWEITAVIMLVGFICDFGWIVLLTIAGISGIIFGFIYWNWLWMLIILICLLAIIGIIIYFVIRAEDSVEDDEDEGVKTKYKCLNCGASVFKKDDVSETVYYCPYCDTAYTKKELVDNIANKKIQAYDLDDLEEEYFSACYYLELKPQCLHTEKQIERKYDHLIDAVYDYEQREYIESAYDFFIDNKDEIEGYMKNYTSEEIASRYEYYLILDEDDEKDE